VRPYVTKADVHHTLEGLAGGDDEGNARSEDYQQALDDVRDALGIDIDEDSPKHSGTKPYKDSINVNQITDDGGTDS
jgi:hypothetical protein